jgi:hypothetical protein
MLMLGEVNSIDATQSGEYLKTDHHPTHFRTLPFQDAIHRLDHSDWYIEEELPTHQHIVPPISTSLSTILELVLLMTSK